MLELWEKKWVKFKWTGWIKSMLKLVQAQNWAKTRIAGSVGMNITVGRKGRNIFRDTIQILEEIKVALWFQKLKGLEFESPRFSRTLFISWVHIH